MTNVSRQILLALVITSGLLTAGENKAFFETTQHNFGVVPRGSLLLHRFCWKNWTAHRIEITEIETNCSCVHVRALPRSLEPGEVGWVELEMDTRPFAGLKQVSVQLHLDPGPRLVRLQVQAFIRPDLHVRPGCVRFAGVSAGQPAERSVDIEYTGPADWQILQVRHPYPFLLSRFEPLYRRPGETGYRLIVQLTNQAPSGDWLATLTLLTNDPQVPTIPLFVEGQIRPAIVATPSGLYFTGPAESILRQRLVLRGEKPFRIVSVLQTPAGIQVEPASDQQHPLQILTVRWLPQPGPNLQGTIRLATDCPDQPIVEIPVHSHVQQASPSR